MHATGSAGAGTGVDLTGTPLPWDAELTAVWQECLTRAARDVPGHARPEPAGDPLLREEVARRTGLPLDRLAVTGGIRAAAGAVLARARTVVVEQPTFADVPDALEARGVRVLRAPWHRMAETAGHSDAAWVTPALRNPDGHVLDGETAAALAAAFAGRDGVVWDTAFAWFAAPSAASATPVPAGVHVLGSLHKLVGPGARLGWAVPATDERDVRRALWLTAPGPVWQRAWAYVLGTGVLDRLRDRLVAQLQAAVPAFLDAAGLPPGPAAPHLLLGVRDEADALRLLDGEVRVGAGAAFHAPEPSIRVSLLGVDPAEARVAGDAVGRLLRVHGTA